MTCTRAAQLALLASLLTPPALAQAPAPAASPRPAPYSLPWLLRPIAAVSVVRLDETVAFSEDAARRTSAATAVTSLTASWKLTPRWVPVFRQTWVHQSVSPANASASGAAFSNPLLGVSYVRPLGGAWRASGFLSSTIPVGSGGGEHPDPGAAAAIAAAVPARSAMDNALFAVNYWTLIGGAGLARVTPGSTLQVEATVLQLSRVRGPESQDAHRTNFTAGLHAGRFVTPRLSLGAELRLQRWMTDAAPVRADPRAREQLTFGVGPRLHFKLRGGHWLRPGLSYSRALDAPMRKRGYDVVQLDVPFAF
jgi:hypothetical protein